MLGRRKVVALGEHRGCSKWNTLKSALLRCGLGSDLSSARENPEEFIMITGLTHQVMVDKAWLRLLYACANADWEMIKYKLHEYRTSHPQYQPRNSHYRSATSMAAVVISVISICSSLLRVHDSLDTSFCGKVEVVHPYLNEGLPCHKPHLLSPVCHVQAVPNVES